MPKHKKKVSVSKGAFVFPEDLADKFLVSVRSESPVSLGSQANTQLLSWDESLSRPLVRFMVPFEPELIQERLSKFLSTFSGIAQKLPEEMGPFAVDSIELSVEISAKGHVGLLGSGGEAGGSGGLKFTLKRKSPGV